MAVFLGGVKNTSAAKCALQINYASQKIIQAEIKRKFPDTPFELKQRVGIDTSNLLVARTGIRGSNDLVWVGNAANNAAKLAALDPRYPTYITASVYNMLKDSSKYGGDPRRDMWTDLGTGAMGYKIYGSTFWWAV
jgi:class 3 adenylate cyclase